MSYLAIDGVFELESQVAVNIEVRNSSDGFESWVFDIVVAGEEEWVSLGDACVESQGLLLHDNASTLNRFNLLTLCQ